MVCKKCGREFDGSFCPYCGERAVQEMTVCPVCGREKADGANFCANCGYSYERSEDKFGAFKDKVCGGLNAVGAGAKKVGGFLLKHKKPVAAITAAVIIALVVIIPTVVHFSNMFRAGKVDKIEIGMEKDGVIEELGVPYNYSQDSSQFVYYSDNYLKLREKLDSLDMDNIESFEDLEDAIINEEKYRAELEALEYSYISISFDNDGKVESVFLDTKCCDSEYERHKDIDEFSLLTTSAVRFEETTLYYRALYTDGSLYKGRATTATPGLEDDVLDVEWTDSFGNELKATVEVQDNPEVVSGQAGSDSYYALDEDGTLTIYGSGEITRNLPSDGVKKVVIEEGITIIGDSAFQGCRALTSVTIPDSVTSIRDDAFSGCTSLQYNEYGNGLYLGNTENPYAVFIKMKSDDVASITIHNDTKLIYGSPFSGCTALMNVTIGDGVTSIGYEAFANCRGLTSVTIGDSVTSIGYRAFYGCSGLTSVTIGNAVTSIGDSAFEDCSGLTSVTIGNAVTSIGDSAFEDCSGLTSIIIPDSVTSIGSLAFSYCDDIIEIEDGVSYVDDWAIDCDTSATSVQLRTGTRGIADNALSSCRDLTSITIPDSVTSIGDWAFYECSGLTSITIPDSVTSIGDYAFSGCSGLTSITIPDSVTSIGSFAFSGFSGLTSITFQGTMQQWKDIRKYFWDDHLYDYTVTCTDGVLNKNGQQIS